MSGRTRSFSRFYYGWVIVAVTLITGAVLLGTRQSYGVFFKSLQSDFDLNRVLTSGIFSLYMAISAVFAVLGGWALDRFGPKWTIAAMGAFAGVSLILSSQVHSLWQMYLTYSLLLAAGTGETYTVVSVTVSHWFQKKRGLALGISQAGGGIGLLIAAPFATFLIVSSDWRTAYVVMGAIALLMVVGPALLLKRSPAEFGLAPDGLPLENVLTEKKAPPPGLTTRQALRTHQFWIIFLIWLLHGTASYIVTTHIVPHATDAGIPAIAAAGILSVFAVANIASGLVMGALSDKIGRKAISIICAVIGAGSMFWLTQITDNVWLYYVFAALFGIPFGGISTMVSALAGDIFGLPSLGKIMGIIGIAWFAGAAIGPLVGGAIFDLSGSYFWAFLIGAICMLGVLFLLAILSRPPSGQPLSRN